MGQIKVTSKELHQNKVEDPIKHKQSETKADAKLERPSKASFLENKLDK